MIKYIFTDIDGTLTDGKISYDIFGNDIKHFNVKDGTSIKKLISNGILVILLTGRKGRQNKQRAKELGIKYLFQNVKDKKQFILSYVRKYNLLIKDGAYFGDDINDLEAMMLFAHRFCPNDASKEILEISNHTSPKAGGKGSFEFVSDFILDFNKGESS